MPSSNLKTPPGGTRYYALPVGSGRGDSSMVCKRCLVGGRVQGVFYRASAAQRARALGISGYARNLPDGRVEVLACGTPESVMSFIGWLWVGPTAAKVTAVDVQDATVEEQCERDGFFTA